LIGQTLGMKKLTHIDARGEASMVDVSAKPVMLREAVASGEVRLQRATLKLIDSQTIAKGNVLAAARLAGILAAKNISLEAVLQEPGENPHDLPFVMTVEPTSEHAVREAVQKMSHLDFLREPPLALPMEPPL